MRHEHRGEAAPSPSPRAELPELPISPYTNLVTANGLAQLHARREAAGEDLDALEPGDEVERAYLARHLRWLQARIDSAVPVGPRLEGRDRVGFGARVEVRHVDGQVERFRIVGEDEADPEHALLSWVAPMARALEGAQAGDRPRWRRAGDDVDVEVLSVRYDDEPGARH